jgi:hypothetical protein
MRFDAEKVTEAAAFLLQLRGGRMHYIKLLKLLYIADRQAFSEWGIPISNDNYVSMDNGRVPQVSILRPGKARTSTHIAFISGPPTICCPTAPPPRPSRTIRSPRFPRTKWSDAESSIKAAAR